MGTYIYRITADVVSCTDGQPANIAVYAYKPTWHGLDAEKTNRRWAHQSGCSASVRLAREGKLSNRIVLGYRDEKTKRVTIEPGAAIYGNERNTGTFADCDLGGKSLPIIRDVRAGDPL